ncbi:MAG: 50S ribosome-binding GTPase [Planctomycetia bacterium]|nr:50S ribosome-binding GTPase [Planctomycetia bacterium]
MKKYVWGYLWFLPFLFLLIPTIYATVVGFSVIYQNWWQISILLILGLLCTILSWLLSIWWIKRRLRLLDIRLQAEEYWSNLEHIAAKEVETYLDNINISDLEINKTQTLLPHFIEILHRVAQVYHPEKKTPEMDIPISDVLLISERVTEDLRIFITENVPGSHLLTLNDLKFIHSAASWSRPAYNAYRVVSVPINPISAFFRETKSWFSRKFTSTLISSIRETAIRYVFRQVGHYAVELYSGRLRMEYLQETGKWVSMTEKRGDYEDLKENLTEENTSFSQKQEPLRILVVGQPKTGKTSLVQSLFSLQNALPDPVEHSPVMERYLITENGEHVLISDAAGYDIWNEPQQKNFFSFTKQKISPFKTLQTEIENTDLIFMVCDANNAAREADSLFIKALRQWAEENPQINSPILIVVMPGIDKLRPFTDWNPPFNTKTPETEKEKNIRDALFALTESLDLDESIPAIPVCLQPGRIYNVEESLRPILMDMFQQMQCVRESRCLNALQGLSPKWKETGMQAMKLGGKVWDYLLKKSE